MVAGRTLKVTEEGLDLAAHTRNSGVKIQALKNGGESILWVGAEVGDGYPLEPGESFPGSIELGSSDGLDIWPEDGHGVAHVVLGYEEVVIAGGG